MSHRRRLENKEPDLLPGQVGFKSYCQPPMQGGNYKVVVSQEIEPERYARQTVTSGDHEFKVIAPKYNLAAGVIDSVYPPTGESVPVTVLPHIVFKDPSLPWERSPTWMDTDEDKTDPNNAPPWMVLLVFSLDELKLDPSELDPILEHVTIPKEERKQTETMSVRMRVPDTQLLENVYNTIHFDTDLDTHDAEASTDVIFIKKDLFDPIFTVPDDKAAGGTRLDVTQYKYMSHVRRVPTDGKASANVEDETSIFSISVSPRTGPLGLTGPESVVVHLVSLDMRPSMRLPVTSDRVALTSLHSWTYTCLPDEGDASPQARLTGLGKEISVLKPPRMAGGDAPPAVPDNPDLKIKTIIDKRLSDGYTIVRHRTNTGEETASIMRGPLVPKPVLHPLREKFCMQSNVGSDLQILDPDLGLMDITYASAWQLGRTLGMDDAAFTTALARLRNAIYAESIGASKVDVHSAIGTYQSRKDTVVGMQDLIRGLDGLTEKLHMDRDAATAMSANRRDHTHKPDGTIHNEHKTSNNADFARVYSWVLDKLHLANVPAHHLLPDPSYLPLESLRSFYIDENWTDALVDGALSLANHWGAAPMQDFCRSSIKKAINAKLMEPSEKLGGFHTPMPRYGFVMRSQVLVQFPDLLVTPVYADVRVADAADPPAPKASKPVMLVQRKLSADAMYCLFNRLPDELQSLTLTLPPHQQRFVIGESITVDTLLMQVKRIHTDSESNKRKHDSRERIETPPVDIRDGKYFDVNSGMVKTDPYLRLVLSLLKENMKGDDIKQTVPSSALMALHLHQSFLTVRILAPGGPDNPTIQSAQPRNDSPDSRRTFQFSLPESLEASPPPLTSRANSSVSARQFHRPRQPSPRREAALVNEYLTRMAVHTPQFNIAVHALKYKHEMAVPSNSRFPLDLVFSIVADENNADLDASLLKIEVEIPCGDMPPQDGLPIPLLATAADSGIPTMLSNLHFDVLKYWSNQQSSGGDDGEKSGTLYLTVVRRSDKGVNINKMTEASFLLPRAQIAKYDGTSKKTAKLLFRFYYQDRDHTVFETIEMVDLKSIKLNEPEDVPLTD